MDKEFSDFVSAVLDKTDIVALIGRYAKLERKGNTYWACCPFHHETDASFTVTPDKQLFHCFGCGKGGNALTFVKEMENVEFYDAVKILAEQAGMEMPKPKFGGERHTAIDRERREKLYTLMRDAARHYHDNLSSPRAKVFNDYLNQRQITPDMVRRFGLGASLDFTEMLDYLTSRGYTYEQMHAVGIAENKDGRQYDVFGKRLMFPIIDNMGNVVAFGGRTLEKNPDFAKYRNSSQTEIFEKNKVIYGINLLKKRKNKPPPIKYVILTEGYMDVIALHKGGFDTAVASMGTALTERQARQLKLYSDLVYISYDGDTAGQKATVRGLDILREKGLTVKVVRLPDGLDPDDVIKKFGSNGYQKLLDEAVPLTAHKIDILRAKYNLNDDDDRLKFATESVTSIVLSLDNPIEQEQYYKYISELSKFSVEALKLQAGRVQVPIPTPPPPEPPPEEQVEQGHTEYSDKIKFFLSSIINCEDYVDFSKDVTNALPDEFARNLYGWCASNPGYKPSDIYIFFDSPILSELGDYRGLPGDNRQKFVDIQTDLYRQVLIAERDRLTALHKSTNDQAVLSKLIAVNSELNKYKKYRS